MFSTLHVHSTKIISFTHIHTRTHTVHVWTHSFLCTHMHHHICINMSMHIYLHTYKGTHHWFLAASSLNAAKGQSICVDPAFVSSFLASYRGSTKLCLQHFYDISLLALLPSLNSNHRVYTILQNFTNGLNYVQNYFNHRIHCVFFNCTLYMLQPVVRSSQFSIIALTVHSSVWCSVFLQCVQGK